MHAEKILDRLPKLWELTWGLWEIDLPELRKSLRGYPADWLHMDVIPQDKNHSWSNGWRTETSRYAVLWEDGTWEEVPFTQMMSEGADTQEVLREGVSLEDFLGERHPLAIVGFFANMSLEVKRFQDWSRGKTAKKRMEEVVIGVYFTP